MEHLVTIDRRAPLAFDRTPLSIALEGVRGPRRHSARSAPLSPCRIRTLRKKNASRRIGEAGRDSSIGRAKLQSNRHHKQTNIHLYTGRMSFLSPNQHCHSTEGKSCPLGECYRNRAFLPDAPKKYPLKEFGYFFQEP